MNSQPLSLRQRAAYGVGDFGINLYFIAAMTYLLYFYTDVYGLSPAVAAGVFLVARVVDAVTDPLMGLVVERTRSRWGRLRPHLRYGALPLGLVAILTFTVPPFGDSAKIVWAYATYVLFGIAYTVVAIPYATMTASITSDHRERTVLSTIRMGFAFAGGYVISVGMLPFVGLFDGESAGFRSAMIVYALVATGLLWLTVAGTEEQVQPPPTQRLRVSDSLRAVFLNPPLLIVIVLFTGGMLSFTIRQTVTVYYLKYNLGREDLVALFFAVTLPVMMVGLIGVPKLAERIGKAGGIVAGAVLTIISALGLYFTPYDQIVWVFVWSGLMALGGTPIAVLGWAMIPDTVEFAQLRLGLRADGAIFAFASFFQKLAKALGGAGVAAALALAGYVANVEQSPQALQAIHNLLTLAPVVIMVGMIIAARAYRLDEAAHQDIVRRLASGGELVNREPG